MVTKKQESLRVRRGRVKLRKFFDFLNDWELRSLELHKKPGYTVGGISYYLKGEC